MSDIGLVDFVTDVLDIHLLPHQKCVLQEIERHPGYDSHMWFRRGDAQSRYIFGWIYKKIWENYLETGEIEFPFDCDDNSESWDREYMCKWSDEDER